MVDEAVGNPGLVGDVGDPGRVVALAREDAHRRVEDGPALVDHRRLRPRLSHGRCLLRHRANGMPRLGGWPARGPARERAPSSARSSSAIACPSPSVTTSRTVAPRVDHHGVSPRVVVRRRLADLAGGDHVELVLDRPRPQQHLPVIAPGHRGERRGHRDRPGAAQREDPEQLGEAKVVTDGHAEHEVLADRGGDDPIAGQLVRGLAIGDASDVHVEHVDLAIGGGDLAVGRDQQRGVGEQLPPGDALGDAAGEQVDPEVAGPGAGGGDRPGRRGARRAPPSSRRRRAGSTSPAGRRARRRRARRRGRAVRPPRRSLRRRPWN